MIDSSTWDEGGFDPDWVDSASVAKDAGDWLGYLVLIGWIVVGAALLLGLLALLIPGVPF